MTSIVSIHLGTATSLTPSPPGEEFLDYMEWDEPNWGTVRFLHGAHSFTLPFVESIEGDEREGECNGGGMSEWDITANFAAETPISTELAIQTLMQFFAQLGALGWERYIHPCAPRLKGAEAIQCAMKSVKRAAKNSLDPAYAPTPEEWEKIVHLGAEWNFRANGVHLSVWMDPEDDAHRGQCQLIMNLKTEELTILEQLHYSFPEMDHVTYHNPDKYRKWLATNLRKLRATQMQARQEMEAELSAEGYTIDQSYQDPHLAWLDRLPLTRREATSTDTATETDKPTTKPAYDTPSDTWMLNAGKVESPSHLGTLVLVAVLALVGYLVYTHPEWLRSLLARVGL